MNIREQEGFRVARIQRFALFAALTAAVLAAVPTLIGLLAATGGTRFLGYPYNTDDHMVYGAWMRQAMDGRFLFDNRFTIDAQPGLTIHLYFLVLGWIAKLTGILGATFFAQVGLSFLFVILASRFIVRMNLDVFTSKLALSLLCLGGGIGFLVWQTFGVAIIHERIPGLSALLNGHLPIDVWQPEAFVLPSMLTNSLFMAALCLILQVFLCVLDAELSWKPVGLGALCLGLLMNIHSYDVLIIALVLSCFLVMTIATRRFQTVWLLRCLTIGAGAILPALWFIYVLRNDPVFQARAATETYAPTFRQLLAGILPAVVLAFGWLWRERGRAIIGSIALAVLLIGMFSLSASDSRGYWLSPLAWILVFAALVAIATTLARPEPVLNLLIAWALVGVIAPYFPGLFQRKLAMGLMIPWAILAALGVSTLVGKLERGPRNLATALGILILSGSSVQWIQRQGKLIRENVSNTAVHAAYLSSDVSRIIDYLNLHRKARTIVLAMPGVPQPIADQPAAFSTPLIPDLNPILSGLTGVYTYAGHWSETPEYNRRRSQLSLLFSRSNDSFATRQAFVRSVGANYVVAPKPDAFSNEVVDLSGLGKVIIDGTQYDLIEVGPQ